MALKNIPFSEVKVGTEFYFDGGKYFRLDPNDSDVSSTDVVVLRPPEGPGYLQSGYLTEFSPTTEVQVEYEKWELRRWKDVPAGSLFRFREKGEEVFLKTDLELEAVFQTSKQKVGFVVVVSGMLQAEPMREEVYALVD